MQELFSYFDTEDAAMGVKVRLKALRAEQLSMESFPDANSGEAAVPMIPLLNGSGTGSAMGVNGINASPAGLYPLDQWVSQDEQTSPLASFNQDERQPAFLLRFQVQDEAHAKQAEEIVEAAGGWIGDRRSTQD